MELTFEKAKQLREIRWNIRDVKDFEETEKYLTSIISDFIEKIVPENNNGEDDFCKREIRNFIDDYAQGEHFHKVIGVNGRSKGFKNVASAIQKILKNDKETNAKRYFETVINTKLKDLFGDEMFEAISSFTLECEEKDNDKVLYYLVLLFKETRY